MENLKTKEYSISDDEKKDYKDACKGTELPDLPPYPMPILSWTEEEIKLFEDIKDSDDDAVLVKNTAKKLTHLWLLLSWSVNQKDIIDIINQPDKDVNTPLYKLQLHLVFVLDKLAKILFRGNILKEIKCLDK